MKQRFDFTARWVAALFLFAWSTWLCSATISVTAQNNPDLTVTAPPAYTGFGPSLQPLFNYGKALQMAWYFYEAQRSGPLPKFDGDLPFHDPATGPTAP